jgi:SAM-dependent methyltransferase
VLIPRPEVVDDKTLAAARAGNAVTARPYLTGKFDKRVQLQERRGERATFRGYLRHGILAAALETAPGAWLAGRLASNRRVHTLSAAALFYHYMKFRFSTPSHRAALPLLWMLDRDGSAPVLDAACGMGHVAFEMSKAVGEQRVVCADLNGAHAFSARRFFVPGAAAVFKADLSQRWPMPDGVFSAVILSDALPYIDDKAAVAREMMRVVRDDGFVALPHLFNGLSPSQFAAGAWSPSQYTQLFEGYATRIFPESHFATAQLTGGELDLTGGFPDEVIRASPALVLIAAKSEAVFRVYKGQRFRPSPETSKTEVCEFYRQTSHGASVSIERHIPKRFLSFHAELLDSLPQRMELKRSEAAGGRFLDEEALVARGILVDLPAAY